MNLLGIYQRTFTNTDSVVYDTECFKIFYGLNSFYLAFNGVDAYFECIDESKYLLFALTDKIRDALENYN